MLVLAFLFIIFLLAAAAYSYAAKAADNGLLMQTGRSVWHLPIIGTVSFLVLLCVLLALIGTYLK